MSITFQFKGNIYNLSIGYKTRWYEQTSLITLIREYYDDNLSLTYAEIVWRS